MRKISLLLTTSLILLSSFTANAVLNMGGQTIFAGTVIEVLEPGPATQIQVIITNITDASDTNPYLIQLGPGVYDLGTVGIVMKQWVSIQGSGQEATKITGAVSTSSRTTSAVMLGVNNTDLTDLTIENTGGGDLSIAILNEGSSPRIERVTATASGGNTSYGIWNIGSASPIMSNVTAEGFDGTTDNYGVYNVDASPMMNNIIATAASSGGTTNLGVSNDNSSPTMINVTASASGAYNNIGIFNYNGSSPVIKNAIASASGGTVDYGTNSSLNASPLIQDSILDGETFGVFIRENSPGTRIVNSKLINDFYNEAYGSTQSQCAGNYDADLQDVNCNAQGSCRDDVTRNETLGVTIEITGGGTTVELTIYDPTGDAGGPITSIISNIPFDGTDFLLEYDVTEDGCRSIGSFQGTLSGNTFSGSLSGTETCPNGESCEFSVTSYTATQVGSTDVYTGTAPATETCCIITGDI